ncbi:M48 family metalloprotease [Rhizobium sp. CRIBSB]|nr:M48 family metalloprotease [Rhizobium sp. CRIBSB]
MSARFLDGRSARSHPAEVAISDGALHVTAADTTHVWPLKGLSVVFQGGEARLSHKRSRDARLVLSEAEWRALAGTQGEAIVGRGHRREWILVGGLAATGLAVAAFVFWGVPALSGPLARATPISFERGMGESFDRQMALAFPRCGGEAGQAVLDDLGRKLAARTDTPFEVRVRAVHAPMVNAFALPGGVVLVTDDLIRQARSPDELSAVIAHEVSHIEKRHVMQAVWRSLGVGVLLDALVGGGTGAGQQAVLLAGQATDLRYGREAESEADRRGQALLHAQGLSSKGMATFFERLDGLEGGRMADAVEFMSTHPDSRRRAQAARRIERGGASAFTDVEWAAVRAACNDGSAHPVERLERRLGISERAAPPDKVDQVGVD